MRRLFKFFIPVAVGIILLLTYQLAVGPGLRERASIPAKPEKSGIPAGHSLGAVNVPVTVLWSEPDSAEGV